MDISPERQNADLIDSADRTGATIVDRPEDRDVSATHAHPFNRPELMKWLDLPTRNTLRAWRIDRVIRDPLDLVLTLPRTGGLMP